MVDWTDIRESGIEVSNVFHKMFMFQCSFHYLLSPVLDNLRDHGHLCNRPQYIIVIFIRNLLLSVHCINLSNTAFVLAFL